MSLHIIDNSAVTPYGAGILRAGARDRLQRNPMWPMPVSIICGCLAAGR